MMDTRPLLPRDLRVLPPAGLASFIASNLASLLEEEAVAILENPHCTPAISLAIAQSQRLAGFYSVRLRLVACRATPLSQAMKLVHYLYWPDLVRLSVDVMVPAPVRRTIDNVLLPRALKLTAGERIAAARLCGFALIKVFLFDSDPRVFESLLVNPRLREDDLLFVLSSQRATTEQLVLVAGDRKWSSRYAIRKALAKNPLTPRATAASQLRHLRRHDLHALRHDPGTSVYLRRCIDCLTGAGPQTSREG